MPTRFKSSWRLRWADVIQDREQRLQDCVSRSGQCRDTRPFPTGRVRLNSGA
jgi:hypothetical protein